MGKWLIIEKGKLFMDSEKTIRKISLEGCPQIGKGAHGSVYQLSDDSVVKVYFDNRSLESIEKERLNGRSAFVSGISCPITFDIVSTEKGYGIVMELAGSMPLGSYVQKHPEDLAECAEKFADIYIQMNSTLADTVQFSSVKENYRETIARASKYFRKKEIDTLLEILDSIPDKYTFVHGDIHPQNVIINDKKELFYIDMADLSYGSCIFDLGSSFLTMFFVPNMNKKNCIEISGMDADKTIFFWNTLIKKYREHVYTDGNMDIEKICEIFGYFRTVYLLVEDDNHSWLFDRMRVMFVRSKVIRHKDKIISCFKSLQM